LTLYDDISSMAALSTVIELLLCMEVIVDSSSQCDTSCPTCLIPIVMVMRVGTVCTWD